VNLARGNAGVIAFTFADILNTFNLDFLLSASELDGLLKIVSTPRVTTQNLQKATIRSGYQLPVQTIANNTVTVQYVDATLKLEVTPQITAEGTVNLMINLKKQDPISRALSPARSVTTSPSSRATWRPSCWSATAAPR